MLIVHDGPLARFVVSWNRQPLSLPSLSAARSRCARGLALCCQTHEPECHHAPDESSVDRELGFGPFCNEAGEDERATHCDGGKCTGRGGATPKNSTRKRD